MSKNIDFIDKYTFVYFDPPYRPLTNTSNFTAYTETLFDDTAQNYFTGLTSFTFCTTTFSTKRLWYYATIAHISISKFFPLTNTSNFTAYTETLFDDTAQKELAAFVDAISHKGAKVLVSNSDPQNSDKEDDFFDKIYPSYKIKKVSVYTVDRNIQRYIYR